MNNTIEIELKKLFDICHLNLKKSKSCMDYLLNTRKMSMHSIDQFQLGYFPQNTSRLLEYVSPTILQKLSIVDYSEKSIFSEYFCLVFPIYSEYQNPIGIGGRTLFNEEERKIFNISKYKNSSYIKANYLYGLNQAIHNIIKNQNVYVVEGFFDKISLESHQIKNAVAICGTAFSKNHFFKLSRYTDKITFVLDRDEAGLIAMQKIYNKYSNHGIKLRFKLLPSNCKDVDDYFIQGGTKYEFLNDLEEYLPIYSKLNI